MSMQSSAQKPCANSGSVNIGKKKEKKNWKIKKKKRRKRKEFNK